MKTRPWHPLLAATAPVLSLYASNVAETPFQNVVVPLVLSLGVAAALVVSFRAVVDCWTRAAVCATPLVVFFGVAGRFGDAWPLVALVAFGAVWLASRATSRTVGETNALLNAFGASVLLLAAAPLLLSARPSPASPARPLPVDLRAAGDRPHVLVIVTDGHGRPDVLAESYPVEAPGLGVRLAARGFSVASGALSNHNMTALSFATMFNLDHVRTLNPDLSPDISELGPASALLVRPWMFDLFRAGGYEVVVYPSAYDVVQYHRGSDVMRDGSWVDEFRRGFNDTSAYGIFYRAWLGARSVAGGTIGGIAGQVLYTQLMYMLDDLPLTPVGSRPRLIVAHLHSPHVPFLFDRQGHRRPDKDVMVSTDGPDWHFGKPDRIDEYRRLYAAQLGYLDDRIVETVDAFLAASDRPAIIVVTGDHGPWSQEEGTDAHLRERMSILHAVRWPGGPPTGWHDAITPVHTMRLVAETALGVSLGPVEDRSYYSTYERPYDLLPVDPAVAAPRPLADSRHANR